MELDTSISLATSCSKLPHSQSTPAGVDGGTRTPPMTPKKGGKMLAVRVQMLNDNITIFQVQAKALGRVLFDQVCKQLNLLEADYFGLEYLEASTRYWLDLEKPMHRQVGLTLVDPLLFFCVKFYTPDPSQLEEEYTRYLFCLQVKRDLAQGHLQCNDNTAALMASYIVQADCGDYVDEDYPDHTYLSTYKFIPHQDQELERRIMENHKKHVGQSPAEADLNLLETARRCELYGMKMHPAKDHEGVPLNLAVAHMGIVVFQNYTKINTFSWAKIRKISFKRKRFLVKLHPEGYGFYQDVVEFFFENRNDCKNFWKKCVENHGFFRCTTVKSIPRQRTRVLSRGSSFRYSGKTQKQVIEYVRENYVKRQTFKRSQSFRQSSSVHSSVANVGGSISAHPLLPLGDSAVAGTGASLSCGSMSMSGVGEKRLGVSVAEDSLSPTSRRRQPGVVATSTPTIGNHVLTPGRTTKGHTSVDIHPPYTPHIHASGVEKDLSTSSEVTSITSSSPQHSYTITAQEFQGQRTMYKTITPRYIHNTSPTDHYNNNDHDLQSTVVNQIKSHVSNNNDYYYLLSSHSSGRYNRTTNRSSQTDIVDLSPDAEETQDLRSEREKELELSNRYTWQRSTSCKELNSARRKRAQELDSATYVTNPKTLNISSEKNIDLPITRYDETTKPPYQPISIKTPSLERSDTVPETKVYSSSYPGTTSSLSTESGDQEGGLEVGGSVLIMDIGSHENLFLSHDDVSHDSYELLEREREYQEMFGGGSHSGSYGSIENLQDDVDIFQMDDLLSKSTNSVCDDVRSEIDSRIGFRPSMGFNEFNELCKENFRKSHEKIYREQLSVYNKNRSNEFREINVKVKPGEVISGFSSESNGASPNTHASVERTKSDPYMAHEKSKPSPPSSISSKTNASQLSLADSDTFKCHSATDIPYTLRKRADMNGTCSKPKSKPLLKSNHHLKDSGLSLSGNLGSIEDNDTTLNISSFESRSPQDFGSICNENSLLDRNYLSIDEPRKEIIKVKSVDSGTTKPAKPIYKIHQSRSAEGIKHKNSSFEKQDSAGNKIKVIKIDSDKCSCDSRKNSTESADAADVIIVEYRDTKRKRFGKKGSSSDNQEARSRGSSVESKDPKLSPSCTPKSGSLSKSSSPNKLSPNKAKQSSSPKDQLSPKALSPKQSPKQLSPKQTSPKQSKSDVKLSPNSCKIVKANLKIITVSPKTTPKTSPKTSPKLSPEVEIVPARKRPPSEKPAIKPKPKVIPKKPSSGAKEAAKSTEVEKKTSDKLKLSEETVEGIKKNLLSPESPWKKFSDLNVSGKDKPPVLFGRLGLSEGSGYTPKNEAVSPGASRRAKSLETPIVALHRLPPITSFSSKDDTLGDDDDEKLAAGKGKEDTAKATTETLREVSDKLAETRTESCTNYGQNAKETLKELLTLVASPVDKMSPTELSPSLTPERRQSTRQERLDSFKKLKNFSIDIWDSGEVEAITNARRAVNIDFELGDDDAFVEPEKSAERESEVPETGADTEPVPETAETSSVKTTVKMPSLEDQMVPQVKPTEGLIFNYDLDNIMVENYTSEEFEPFPVLAETLSPTVGGEVLKSNLDADTTGTTQGVGVSQVQQEVVVTQPAMEVAEKVTPEEASKVRSEKNSPEESDKVRSEKNSLEEEEVWVSVDEYLEDDKDKSFAGYQAGEDGEDDKQAPVSKELVEPEPDVVQKPLEVEVKIIPAPEQEVETIPAPETVVEITPAPEDEDEEVEAPEAPKSDEVEEEVTVEAPEISQANQDVNQIFDELPSVEEDSVFDAPDAPPPPPAIDYIISETPPEVVSDLRNVPEPSTSSLPVPALPEKRSFDDEPSTSSSGMRVGESSTWRPFPLESSGSSSLEEGLFPPDDTGHYADEEGEDGSSKDDDFPTNFNYPITSAEIMLSGGFGGGVFGLSRTLSRISERSTTSEQERSDFEDDISTKQSSHSISEEDDSMISSDRPPSVSTGSASGSQADLGYDDFPPLPDLPEEKSPDDESLETIKIPPPFIPSNSEENWPSPPVSPPVITPVTSQVETFFIKPEEAAKVSIKIKQEEGEDSSTEENKTLQEEDMPPSVFSDSFTLVEEKPEPTRKKRNSDDTSIGFTTSDWSSSTGTTVKQHFGIAKSDDSSLAGDFGLSLSTEMLASGSKCSSRKSSDDTTPVLHVYYPLKQRSFDDYDSPYTTESDDTVSLSVSKPSPQKPFQQYYSAFNISPTKSQPKFLPKDRRNRLGNKSPNSSRGQLDCPPTLEEIESSFERSRAKSIARAKCYSYYSLARSPPSDASSSSLELPESLTAPNTIPRVSKRRKTHPMKKRQRIIMTEINVDQPDAPIQSPKSYCTATLRKSAHSPSHSKPTQDK